MHKKWSNNKRHEYHKNINLHSRSKIVEAKEPFLRLPIVQVKYVHVAS